MTSPVSGVKSSGSFGAGAARTLAQKRQLFLLGKRGVIGRHADGLEDFGHRGFVPHRMLAHIEPGDAEAEKRDLLAEPVQFALGEQGGAMGGQAFADEIEQFRDLAGFQDGRGAPCLGIEQPLRTLRFFRPRCSRERIPARASR